MKTAVLPARRVRRLHLRATTADHARHGAIVLADALHTATMPAADQGRLVVIRRLALGKIDPGVTSATLSLRIERMYRSLAAHAVSVYAPDAADAPAVSFHDVAEAFILLTRRVAARKPLHEWYWRAMFPGLNPDRSSPAFWRWLLDRAHAQPAPLQTVAAMVEEAVRHGAGSALVAGLLPMHVRTWLKQLSLDPEATAVGREPYRHADPSIESAVRLLCDNALAPWGGSDSRSVWIAAVALQIVRPSTAPGPAFMTLVREVLLRREENAPVNGREITAPEPPVAVEAEGMPPAEAPGINTKNSGKIPEAKPVLRSRDRPASSAFLAGGERTLFGGTMFLIPVFSRIGMDGYLAQNPALADAGLARRCLWNIAQRAGMPQQDPLSRFLTELFEAAGDPWPFPVATPVAPHGAGATPSSTLASAIGTWRIAARHWCRRTLRMGLTTLIRRPGRVTISRTHIDLCFDLNQADPRVRRQALDVDPGWVPWLGRVIRYHYDNT